MIDWLLAKNMWNEWGTSNHVSALSGDIECDQNEIQAQIHLNKSCRASDGVFPIASTNSTSLFLALSELMSKTNSISAKVLWVARYAGGVLVERVH